MSEGGGLRILASDGRILCDSTGAPLAARVKCAGNGYLFIAADGKLLGAENRLLTTKTGIKITAVTVTPTTIDAKKTYTVTATVTTSY